MQSLQSTLRSFEVPRHTRAEWDEINRRSEEWERTERRRRELARFGNAHIPAEFRAADVGLCDPKVAGWVRGDLGKGLLLQGRAGVGKTYSACAALIANLPRMTARFATMDGLIREIKATFQGMDTEEAVLGRYACVGLLCLDDVGKERLTEWSMPIFFALINGRYQSGRPTIVTTQYRSLELAERFTVGGDSATAKALISRMAGYEHVVLSGDDRRLRGRR